MQPGRSELVMTLGEPASPTLLAPIQRCATYAFGRRMCWLSDKAPGTLQWKSRDFGMARTLRGWRGGAWVGLPAREEVVAG